MTRHAGALLLASGVVLAAWAVMASGDNDLSRPATLNTRGPYALSRNPMYMAWTLACAGSALLVNSLWIAALTSFAWLYLHLVTIPSEERFLSERFGPEYETYRRRAGRYL